MKRVAQMLSSVSFYPLLPLFVVASIGLGELAKTLGVFRPVWGLVLLGGAVWMAETALWSRSRNRTAAWGYAIAAVGLLFSAAFAFAELYTAAAISLGVVTFGGMLIATIAVYLSSRALLRKVKADLAERHAAAD